MANNPVSTTFNLNRDEYAAIAKPLRGQWNRLFKATVICGAPISLIPILVSAVILGNRIYVEGQDATTAVADFLSLWPLYVGLQAVFPIIGGILIANHADKGHARLRRLFPIKHRRETVITRIMPYGIVQSSAGVGAVTPWRHVSGIAEIEDAFVLQTHSGESTNFASIIDLVYILKSSDRLEGPAISTELLENFRSASTLLPNYLWHARLNGAIADADPATGPVWPPPPIPDAPTAELGMSLAGILHVSMLQAAVEGSRLSLKLSHAANLRTSSGAVIMGLFAVLVATLLFNLQSLTSAPAILAAAAALIAVSGVSFAIHLWSRVLVRIDRKKSQVTVNGSRCSAISEIESITVATPANAIVLFTGNKRATITIRKTNGKQQRFVIEPYITHAETNIIAMILGQYLTESLNTAAPNRRLR